MTTNPSDIFWSTESSWARCCATAFVLLGLGLAMAGQATAMEWENIAFTPFAQMQGVNEFGGPTWSVPLIPPDDQQAYRLRGVVLNVPEEMLDTTPHFQDGPEWFMGGQWQVFIQAVPSNEEPLICPDELVGNTGGASLWMGQNYGNHGWHYPDPTYSYTDAQWLDELDRLNWPIDATTGQPVTEPLRPGDLIEVRARGGLHYRGKFNCNEQHNNDPAFDFDIIVLARDVPVTPVSMTLADVIAADGTPIFDQTRATGAELYQGRCVTIKDVTITDATAWQADGEITISDGTRELTVWLGHNGAFDAATLPLGTLDLTGFFDQEAPFDEQDKPLLKEGYFAWAMSPTDFMPSTVTPGDATNDGTVDAADAAVLASRWLASDGVGWFDGDFNGDGVVDDLDASILAANWTATGSPEASVPEPAAGVLLFGFIVSVSIGAGRRRGARGSGLGARG
ncbi:MAG: hypothetical protein JW818_16690 [Pirellulales bacterium]|nr:hypothetical protein [Pirellulales bacterium]